MTIRRKIQILIAGLVLFMGVCVVTVLLVQQNSVHRTTAEAREKTQQILAATSEEGTAVIARDVYLMCRAQQEATEQKVVCDLNVAENLLKQTGEVSFAEEKVTWKVANQLTKEETTVELPKMMVGDTWLGQNSSTNTTSPVVDEIRSLVGGTCTIFQRMNEAGDMLRVSTNVEKLDQTRAIGTYIPAVDPDGKANPVIAKVLDDETFQGRAYVVNDWYITAYKPIKDASGRIVGMLYVGVKQENVASLRQGIMDIVVGKTGYVYIIGGSGDQRGKYIISKDGERDGENIIDAKDSNGTPFIREIVEKATAMKFEQDGKIPVAYQRYPWKNQGEETARGKIAAVTYFEPWDWVIGAGCYEDDFADTQITMNEALDGVAGAIRQMIVVTVSLVLGLTVLGIFLAGAFGKSVSKILRTVIGETRKLSDAAVEGQLQVRGNPELVSPEFRPIIEGMNQTLENFAKPIEEIGEVLKRLARKDFSHGVETEYSGAYGKLRNDVNLVVSNVRAAIEQITESAGQFTEGSRVIAESSQTLASGAQDQSSSVEEITASIEELSRSVQGVKNNTQEADSVAKETSRLAQQGGAAVQKSIEAMELIRNSSMKIAEIIQVISEIASQTNLLALNAAIEAARAGEHGMGFAVVADEVRKLAERANHAAGEITSLIRESTNQVEQGAQLSDETGEALKRIVEGVEATAAKIGEITAATVQQASNADEVSKAIQGIAQVTEQSAAGSEEMASSSEELGAQAQALRDLVGQFTIGRGASSPNWSEEAELETATW